jgi:Phage integrase, N-terminal SAM-like domain
MKARVANSCSASRRYSILHSDGILAIPRERRLPVVPRRMFMGMLRERTADDLKLRGLAENTQESYLRNAQRFADHYAGRSPLKLGEREVRDFLLHLVKEEGIAPATQAVCLASLKFLYEVTLNKPEVVERIRYPRGGSHCPTSSAGARCRGSWAASRRSGCGCSAW